jgi:hypothetical protein
MTFVPLARTRESMPFRVKGAWVSVIAGMMILPGCKRTPQGDPNSLIACQPEGASAFERICTVERDDSPDGAILTLRHPDGRFRRLLVTSDGQGVTAADGAEPAGVRMNGNREIEVRIAGDRYRLPARPKAEPAAP